MKNQTFLTSWIVRKPPKKKSKYSGMNFKFKPKQAKWYQGVPKIVKTKLALTHKKNVLRMFIRKARQAVFQKKLAIKRGLARRGLRDMIPAVMSFAGFKR